MIGRASLEWNSSAGIGVDAWQMLGTASVTCDIYEKVRSLDGDCAHRDKGGRPLCERRCDTSDLEQENIPALSKGKGRAY